ncbi:DUF4405 domain-containing protein [Pseudodesulfovibrio sediminis]|uniref:Flavinylation-associated cytochrome domain-containing protein n=1 Tax=Pseudodesulfovibrio sediminis TaxID=2810563 RepID=A0ABM7P9F8_9BACT|nr:DUF4405 domain-containing protein [Pseudodesulfovibrio sediminis]BCS89682.1 hypothetical protein PSDVSF_29240 [Pseudodesulfovibrio sediminis]
MLRKITSLTALISFLVTIVTSVVLYIVPEGRVANWADWQLFGLTKGQWGDTHLTVGTLFFIALLLHVFLNLKPLMAYMKNKARELVVMTVPMIISILLTVAVFAGTLLGLSPMQDLLDLGTEIKADATEMYGNPPYGHAETSPLMKFCGFLGFDVTQAVEALHAAGYDSSINERSLIKDIARSKGVSPQQVFNDIRMGQDADPFDTMPLNPPEGTGKVNISTICMTYGLDKDTVFERLEAAGIAADDTSTFKELAEKHKISPKEIYMIVKGSK